MTFWLLAALLILLGLVFVLLPLLHSRNNDSRASRVEINRVIYQEKVNDIDADLERGLLDQDEYENALAELQQTLLQDASQEEIKASNSGSNTITVLVVALALPVAALFVYKQVSTYKTPDEVAQLQANAAQGQSIQGMIANLERKLEEDPDNVQGWRMLGQSYFTLQQYDLAKNAYIKAADLVNQSDPDILILLAEASAFSNGDSFGEYEHSLLNRALAINPNHERGLWYAGYAAYIESNFSEASRRWGELLKLVPTDKPDVKETLLRFLNDARTKAGLTAIAGGASSNAENENQRSIKATVQLNESVNQKAESGDALFIYARAVNGPKMPLSLAKLKVANLPITVNLTKEMAMLPNMNIDSFEQVEVLARISKSGQAISQPGDLISSPVTVDFSKSPKASVELDINSVVE